MTKTVEFYFDLISPPSYLAFTQLPEIAALTGAEIVWKPVLVGAIHKATGNTAPIAVPAKGRYLMEDLKRFARRYGVPFELNPHFPFSTLLHQRIATGLLRTDANDFERYVSSMFEAIWVEGLDVSEPAAIAELLTDLEIDAQAAIGLAGEQWVKDALRQTNDEAVERGAFGVPTFFVGERMFWGQDRLDFVREALE